MNRCQSINPETNKRCDMAQGHVGSHIVGNPYHPAERWVTKCKDCTYHSNSNAKGERWIECIYCGDIKHE